MATSIFNGNPMYLPPVTYNFEDYTVPERGIQASAGQSPYDRWLYAQNSRMGSIGLPSFSAPYTAVNPNNPYASPGISPIGTAPGDDGVYATDPYQPITPDPAPWQNPAPTPTPTPQPTPQPTTQGVTVAVGGGSPGSNNRGMDSPEMQAYFAKSKSIRDMFYQYQNDPQTLMQQMQERGIGAKELHDTMDFSGGLDTDLWLRQNGAAPGQFSDLTVYSPEQIDRFLNTANEMNAAGNNGLSMKMDPYDLTDSRIRAQMQETMDRDVRRADLRQSGNPAWFARGGGVHALAGKYNIY